MPIVSIIVPTNRPANVIEPCLRALAAQRFALAEMQVIVVYNGKGSEPGWATEDWPFDLVVARGPESNVGAARNVGFDLARGEWVILLNDDVWPERDLVAAHVNVHRRLDRPGMVLGEAVWRRHEDETVFDRMLQSTSMVFFYDKMRPHTWYNYRHAWTLNLSLSRRYCDTVRFDEAIHPVCFDDLEWAFRLERTQGLGVWFAPEARAVHDHRYTLESYLAREHHLGRMAALLWRCNPECYAAIHGSALDAEYLEYCRRFVAANERLEDDLRTGLERMVSRRIADLSPSKAVRSELIQCLYHAHLPLKRLVFHRALLEAVGGPVPHDQADFPINLGPGSAPDRRHLSDCRN